MDKNIAMEVVNRLHNFSTKLALVERNIAPQGIPLVDATGIAETNKQDLMKLAAEVEKADNCVRANTLNKLCVITEQIKYLQRQTEHILIEAGQNARLNGIACNFVKQPGHIYHLYERESGQLYFSMLTPEEWGNSISSQVYKGSFKLEYDHSWTQLNLPHQSHDRLHEFNTTSTNEVLCSLLQTVITTALQ